MFPAQGDQIVIGRGDGTNTTFPFVSSPMPNFTLQTFHIGDSTTTTATVPDGYRGAPKLYKTDWQGTNLLYTTARTNLATKSEDATAWTVSKGGVASLPVVTGDYGVAPDGNSTADRVVFALNGGTLAADFSILNTTAAAYTSGTPQTFSLWLKTVDGSTKVIRMVSASGNSISLLTVTGVWQRFAGTNTPSSSGTGSAQLRLRGNELTSDSADLLVWGLQIENVSAATPYIVTTTAAVTITDYSIDLATGIATFAIAPATGSSIGHVGSPDIYVTDWQGNQKQYSVARTNLLTNAAWGGGGDAPTAWPRAATGTSGPVASTSGGPGVAYEQSAVVQRSYLSQTIGLLANTTYVMSVLVENVTGTLTVGSFIGSPTNPAGSTISYPVCTANPGGGSSSTLTTGVLLLLVSTAGTAGDCIVRVGLGVTGNVTGSIRMSHPQLEVGSAPTSWISTGSPTTVTDYSISSAGVVFANAPALGSWVTRKFFNSVGRLL